MSIAESTRQNIQMTGPFDSLRDYILALDARGKLLRVKEIDQDQYHATGLMYRLIDKYGPDGAPAVLFERVKTNGEWQDGPIVSNLYPTWANEALSLGVEDITDDEKQMYNAVMDKLKGRMDENSNWEKIAPVEINRNTAPCKEVIITGDNVDIEKFPWFKNNPSDGGRYINTGAVIMVDPELGRNTGTYRCQVKGKIKIGVNSMPGQHGWRIFSAKKRRGDKVAEVAIALGADPILWCTSCTKLAGPGEDELSLAGGLRGKPIELVKCETSDILVPAHAEMIIEGEVPLDQMEPEGPYGEMYGYMGPRIEDNFFMNVKAITHRHNPWFANSFTGLSADLQRGPLMLANYARFKKLIPSLTAINPIRGASGITALSIDKKFPGEGIMAGQYVAANASSKIVIVLDKDVDVLNTQDILHAVGSRWQPSAHAFTAQTRITMPDPSLPKRGMTSKIVIDATRQFPEEGGPKSWPPVSRALLEESAPNLFNEVDENWDSYLENWPSSAS